MNYIEKDYRHAEIRDGGLFWLKTVILVIAMVLFAALAVNFMTT